MGLSGIGVSNHLFNSAIINQKINRNKSLEEQEGNYALQLGTRDSAFISKQGKQNSIIQQLMDQKQLIQECKDAEMKRGLENGYMDQKKIDEYDNRLEMLDKKVAEAMTEQSVNSEDKKNTEQKDNKVLTQEEYEKNKFIDMMSLSSGLEGPEALLSVKGKMDGEASVLKAEIKSDGGRVSENKLKRAAEIEAESPQLLSQVGEKISDINNTMSNLKEVIYKEDDGEDNKNLDNI